jgi:hypothetical protein
MVSEIAKFSEKIQQRSEQKFFGQDTKAALAKLEGEERADLEQSFQV